MEISDRQRFLEILAVVITGFGKFVFMDFLNWRFLYISVAILFWASYVGYRFRKNNKVLAYWGLTTVGFKKTFLELLPLAMVALIVFVLLGNYLETSVLNWTVLPIMLIYPLWGIVQQFIIVGLIARNMKDMKKVELPEVLIILLTAVVFAVVHFPFLLLVGATFLLALLYSFLYLRGRNLLVLGLYHGWLGAVFFYTVMGRDAWAEVFGGLGG